MSIDLLTKVNGGTFFGRDLKLLPILIIIYLTLYLPFQLLGTLFNSPTIVNEPIPSAINVMRRGADTPEQQMNLGLGGVTPANPNLQEQMLQYGAGDVNQFREQPLSSLNVSEQARSEIATFLPQMSVDQQEAFLQGVRDGKVSEYEVENHRRLRQGY